MIPRRGQGVAGEVSGLSGQFVERSPQLVGLPSFLLTLATLFCSFFLLMQGEQRMAECEVAASYVFRRHSAGSPN
jgi:hypothetical protein